MMVRPEDASESRRNSRGRRARGEGVRGWVASGDRRGDQPGEIARHVSDAVREGRFWILPDPSYKAGFETRARSILEELNLLQSKAVRDTPQ